MFILFDASAVCSDPAMANIIYIIKKAVNLLWIIGPILALISCSVSGLKLMNNPDEKKYKTLFKNCFMALLILFILPALINILMNLMANNFEVASCWKNAEAIHTNGQDSGYIDDNDRKPSGTILPNPDDYDAGEKKETSSSDDVASLENSSSNSSASNETYVSKKNGIKYKIYNQADSAWGNTSYSSGGATIANNGCMITSDAVILSSVNENITPLTVFKSSHRHSYPRNAINSMGNGYWSCNSGSSSSSEIENALNEGKVVVIKAYGEKKGGSNKFTYSQHYMALLDISGDKIYVGNAYAKRGRGVAGWYPASEVLTSVQTADYCTPSSSLIDMHK